MTKCMPCLSGLSSQRHRVVKEKDLTAWLKIGSWLDIHLIQHLITPLRTASHLIPKYFIEIQVPLLLIQLLINGNPKQQQMMVQILMCLQPKRKTWIKLLVPGSWLQPDPNLAQPWLWFVCTPREAQEQLGALCTHSRGTPGLLDSSVFCSHLPTHPRHILAVAGVCGSEGTSRWKSFAYLSLYFSNISNNHIFQKAWSLNSRALMLCTQVSINLNTFY